MRKTISTCMARGSTTSMSARATRFCFFTAIPRGRIAGETSSPILNRSVTVSRPTSLGSESPITPTSSTGYSIKSGTSRNSWSSWTSGISRWLEATYHNWSREYGEQRALADMERVFGKEYPAKGMLLAMGTHSLHQDTWLINGVVRQDDINQPSLF